eukprot:UN27835
MDFLKPDGVMNLMVYGRYGRTGVYQFQDMYRMLGQEKRDPELGRALHATLPKSNWLSKNPTMSRGDFKNDNGFVDLFMHHCDQAFTIPQLHGWLVDQGLGIIEFQDDDNYKMPHALKDKEIRSIVEELPYIKQKAFVELYKGDIYKHYFYAAKQDLLESGNFGSTSLEELNENNIICWYSAFLGQSMKFSDDLKEQVLKNEGRGQIKAVMYRKTYYIDGLGAF